MGENGQQEQLIQHEMKWNIYMENDRECIRDINDVEDQ